jgi:hypothetical protein
MQQLTDALLDMESEKSIWTAKEKAYLETNQRLNICLDENRKLSEDLIKVPVPLAKSHVYFPITYASTMSNLLSWALFPKWLPEGFRLNVVPCYFSPIIILLNWFTEGL